MKRMCVIGSLNVDVVTTVDRFPKLGESVLGNTFEVFTGGGKGANQAYALGRLGADVLMVGKIGAGFYGPDYLKVLEACGIDCSGVKTEPGYPGIGIIVVNSDGDNLIVYYPGANDGVDVAHLDAVWEKAKVRDIFLFQLEIPTQTTLEAMRRAAGAGKTVIFDPAPAKRIPEEMLVLADFVTPNETELESLAEMPVADENDIRTACHRLISKGARCVIAKAGKRGAYIADADGIEHVSGFKVTAVDPTAAGDSFNAGFACGLASEMGVRESVRFANAVAGLSTTAVGAQSAMPTLDEVNRFIEMSGSVV